MKKRKLKNKFIITVILILLILIIASIIYIMSKSNKKITQTTGEVMSEQKNQIDSEIVIPVDGNTDIPNKKPEENNITNEKDHNIISSEITYYIKINNSANVVTIYKKDENGNYTIPVKAMVCSTGTATPQSGKYKIPGVNYRWGTLFGHTPGTYVYGQYTTKIVGNILFHSVPYTRNGDSSSLEYWEYDKLGTKASAGCIRLTVQDAYWIYSNISKGTIVEFYSDENPGPLGKPSSRKISENIECRGWDPTDFNTNNPWRNNNEQTSNQQPNEPEENKPDIDLEENKTLENNIIESNTVENNTVENNAIENNTIENNIIVNNTL